MLMSINVMSWRHEESAYSLREYPGKTADISRCHRWFPYKMTSAERAQTFHRGSPIGFSRPKFSCNPVIPRVIFDIPLPVHTFNPDSGPDVALKSRIPSFKQGKSRILKNLLRTLSILMTLRYRDLGSVPDKLKICFILIALFSCSLR